VETNVHIGNYGVSNNDIESDSIKIAGLVCSTFAHHHSRKTAVSSIDDYFINNQVVGIQGLDTRAIVRHVRDKGAMNAIISSEITDIDQLKAMMKRRTPIYKRLANVKLKQKKLQPFSEEAF
jgi:carbamoyl-phosphate synthase small subunit